MPEITLNLTFEEIPSNPNNLEDIDLRAKLEEKFGLENVSVILDLPKIEIKYTYVGKISFKPVLINNAISTLMKDLLNPEEVQQTEFSMVI